LGLILFHSVNADAACFRIALTEVVAVFFWKLVPFVVAAPDGFPDAKLASGFIALLGTVALPALVLGKAQTAVVAQRVVRHVLAIQALNRCERTHRQFHLLLRGHFCGPTYFVIHSCSSRNVGRGMGHGCTSRPLLVLRKPDISLAAAASLLLRSSFLILLQHSAEFLRVGVGFLLVRRIKTAKINVSIFELEPIRQ
jgi:hypothetical protein